MSRPKSRLQFNPDDHTYTLRGLPVPSVTTIIDFMGEYLQLPQDVLEAARERGQEVHRLTALWDADGEIRKDEFEPNVWAYLAAWTLFEEEAPFSPHLVEVPVASDRHLFAGTIDRVGWINGALAILDIKTSAAVNPLVALQVAAYQRAYNEMVPQRLRATKRFAVQLRPNGSYRLHEYKDPADWSTFLAMLQIRNWRERFA